MVFEIFQIWINEHDYDVWYIKVNGDLL